MVCCPADREGAFHMWVNLDHNKQRKVALEMWMCKPDMTYKQIKMTLWRYLDLFSMAEVTRSWSVEKKNR